MHEAPKISALIHWQIYCLGGESAKKRMEDTLKAYSLLGITVNLISTNTAQEIVDDFTSNSLEMHLYDPLRDMLAASTQRINAAIVFDRDEFNGRHDIFSNVVHSVQNHFLFCGHVLHCICSIPCTDYGFEYDFQECSNEHHHSCLKYLLCMIRDNGTRVLRRGFP